MSRFHFQRVFKAQMGMNLYESIKSIRLQKAASLLITNRGSTISDVASACGYGSQSAFIRAFKARFFQTPTQWRLGGYSAYVAHNISSSASASVSRADYSTLEPRIIKTKARKAYYLRHRGYSPEVKKVWQMIEVWRYSNHIEQYQTIGLYHDNPIVTPLAQCGYVAAIVVEEKKKLSQRTLPGFTIPAGLHACFRAKGQYGDILRLIEWAYHVWLPKSGYETTTMPSYTLFEKNHFLEEDERFIVEYYLPIRLH